MLTRGERDNFRESALQAVWPDLSQRPPRKESDKPLKTDARRKEDAHKKWGGIITAGDLHGMPLRVPRIWGDSPGAVDARQHGAELTGKGVVFPESSSGPGVKASLVVAPDACDCEGDTVCARHAARTWAPREEHTEDRWGATSKALAASRVGDRSPKAVKVQHDGGRMFAVEGDNSVRGLHKACEIYRTFPTVGSVAIPTAADRPVAGKVAVGKSRKVVTAKRAKDLAALSVRETVGTTDLDAARIKRAATPVILCDARNAPPRRILAF